MHTLHVKKTIFILYILFGLSMNFFVLPFQKPDETVHFVRSLLLSRLQIPCGQKTLFLRKSYQQVFEKPSLLFHSSSQRNMFPLQEKGNSIVRIKETCSQPFISYIPYAIVLAILDKLKLNGSYVFYFGRMTYFCISLCFVYFLLFRSKRRFGNILVLLFFSPVVVQQMTAYSYDGAHLLLGFLLFYLFLTFEEKKTFLFSLVLCLFLSVKSGWDFFVFLPFALHPQKVKGGPKGIFRMVLFGVVCIVFVRIHLILRLFHSSSSFALFTYMPLVNPQAQFLILKTNPFFFLKVLSVASLIHGGYYLKGMVGLLGYGDHSIPTVGYLLYAGLFIYVFVRQKRGELSLNIRQTVVIVIMLITNYIYIQLLQFLTFTQVGRPDIIGAVGRYFLVFVPFFILLLFNIIHEKKIRTVVISFTTIIVLISCIIVGKKYIEKKMYTMDAYTPLGEQTLHAFRKIPVGNYIRYYQLVEPSKTLSTLVFYFENKNNDVPYLIEIKDADCKKILKSEFLDWYRVEEKAYRMKTEITGQKKICIEIRSLGQMKQNRLFVYRITDTEIVKPLYRYGRN